MFIEDPVVTSNIFHNLAFFNFFCCRRGKILILILLPDTWSSQKNFLENAGLAVEMAVVMWVATVLFLDYSKKVLCFCFLSGK